MAHKRRLSQQETEELKAEINRRTRKILLLRSRMETYYQTPTFNTLLRRAKQRLIKSGEIEDFSD